MKTLTRWAVLLALTLTAAPCWAAYVQAVSLASSAYPATTSAITVTAGDTLIECVMAYQNPLSNGPTSSQGDTFTEASDSPQIGNWNLYVYYVKSAVGGSTTFTSGVNGGYVAITVVEFSGESSSAPIDQIATGYDSSSVTSHPSVSITTTKTEDLIACGSSDGANPTSYTAGAGWTTNTSLYSISSQANAFAEYQNAASSGSYAGAYTTGSATQADYFTISLAPSSGSSCTHLGWNLATGNWSVPTAGVGKFLLQSGGAGPVDCSTTKYWQKSGGFGVN